MVDLATTPVAINWGTAASPTPQNVSIPSDTTAVYVFTGGYKGDNVTNLPSYTLAGDAPDQEVSATGLAGTRTSGKGAVWYNPPTGTQSLGLTWDGVDPQTFGPCSFIVCVRNGNTSAWRDGEANNTDGTTPCSVTLTTVSGDLVLKFDVTANTGTPPGLSAGWTNGQTQAGVNNDSARLSYIYATGATQVCDCENENYSLVIAVSIPDGVIISIAWITA